MVLGLTTFKGVNGFSDTQIEEICAYLLDVVHRWCDRNGYNWFAARDLIGGVNYDWTGKPLQPLFDYYQGGDEANNDYAKKEAGKAAGRLMKRVLIEDNRRYETREGYTREYRLAE